jgi:hypothetical protein
MPYKRRSDFSDYNIKNKFQMEGTPKDNQQTPKWAWLDEMIQMQEQQKKEQQQ